MTGTGPPTVCLGVELDIQSSSKKTKKKAHFYSSACISGTVCESVDHCEPNPCRNNGTCSPPENGLDEFECLCQPGFRGRTCTDDVDECLEDLVRCENGGTCINLHGTFKWVPFILAWCWNLSPSQPLLNLFLCYCTGHMLKRGVWCVWMVVFRRIHFLC